MQSFLRKFQRNAGRIRQKEMHALLSLSPGTQQAPNSDMSRRAAGSFSCGGWHIPGVLIPQQPRGRCFRVPMTDEWGGTVEVARNEPRSQAQGRAGAGPCTCPRHLGRHRGSRFWKHSFHVRLLQWSCFIRSLGAFCCSSPRLRQLRPSAGNPTAHLPPREGFAFDIWVATGSLWHRAAE